MITMEDRRPTRTKGILNYSTGIKMTRVITDNIDNLSEKDSSYRVSGRLMEKYCLSTPLVTDVQINVTSVIQDGSNTIEQSNMNQGDRFPSAPGRDLRGCTN